MPKASPIQTSFNAGEFSPLMDGRVDFEKFRASLSLCSRWVPVIQGPVLKCPGTPHIINVRDDSKKSRLIPFQFSTEQAYQVEFADLFLRFFKDHALILDGPPVEVASPYSETEVPDVQFVQSADVLYLFHPDFETRKLTRTSDIAWTLTTTDFMDGPFGSVNPDATNTMTPNGTTGSITLTTINDTFVSTDIGRLVRFQDSAAEWTWLEITAFSSTKIVTALVRGQDLATTTASDVWRLGVFSETTGYPATGTFFEDRLMVGGATFTPQRIDGSKTGDYENFEATAPDGTVASDNAVSFTFNARQVNAIQWMDDGEKGLTVGTTGGEWIVRPSTLSEALSPTNVQAKKSTAYGSKRTTPLSIANATLFIQKAARKVRELTYVFELDGFRAPDLTILAEHVSQTGLAEIVYQQEPHPIVWARREDGLLLGMSYSRNEDAIGWHRHPIAGVSDAQGSPAIVESISVIQSPDGTRDELWMIVQRYVDGTVVRHIEYMDKFWESGDDPKTSVFLDSALSYSGAPVTTLSGLDHLEGETVGILADGATHPDKTVSGGEVTLDRETSDAIVGLSYQSNLETQRIEAGAADGTAQGKTKRIHRVVVRLIDTLGLKYGRSQGGVPEDIFALEFRKGSDPMDQAPPLFTGDKDLNWPAGYDTEGRMYIRHEDPLPATIAALMPQLLTQDR
ncbi:MAG: hypothetical protein KAT00_05790 [Planctomycetes bacterium]|nr:hypothetical protein [Planctomycetota bacterium]